MAATLAVYSPTHVNTAYRGPVSGTLDRHPVQAFTACPHMESGTLVASTKQIRQESKSGKACGVWNRNALGQALQSMPRTSQEGARR